MEATADARERTITVEVNNQPVTFDQRKATGLEIKQAAIAQGVDIKVDFALYEVHGEGDHEPIPDNKEVTLHPHQEFRAVATDDNS